MRHGLAVFLLVLNTAAEASDSLAPDSVFCEREELIVTLVDRVIPGMAPSAEPARGSAIMADAANQKGLADIRIAVHREMLGLANSTADKFARLREVPPPQVPTIKRDALAGLAEWEPKVRALGEFLTGCASSGPDARPAVMLESRPISRRARLRLDMQGRPAEVWVRITDIGQ